MNYNSILKRAKKVIKEAEGRMNQPVMTIIQDGDDLPETQGLLIITFNPENLTELAA